MLDAVGWIATVVFTVSYFAKDPTKLRWIQSGAAVYSSLRLFKERRTAASGLLK
jgi:hypothetical protein